jgi:hypothetical protein
MTDTRFVRCSECGALNEPRAVFCSRCGASLPGPAHGSPSPRFNSASLGLGAALFLALVIIVLVLYSTVSRSLDKTASITPYKNQAGIPASTSTSTTVNTDANGAPVTTVGPQEGPQAATTTTESPLLVRPKATVSSSALKGISTASFQATNLVDGDLATAWVEGAKGTGLGEWVRFEFAQPTLLARIEVANGYQKDPASFARNPRVKLVNVEFSSGGTYLVELYDTTDLQTIIPAGEAIDWVKLVIVSVYPGENDYGTALSEVRLFEKAD